MYVQSTLYCDVKNRHTRTCRRKKQERKKEREREKSGLGALPSFFPRRWIYVCMSVCKTNREMGDKKSQARKGIPDSCPRVRCCCCAYIHKVHNLSDKSTIIGRRKISQPELMGRSTMKRLIFVCVKKATSIISIYLLIPPYGLLSGAFFFPLKIVSISHNHVQRKRIESTRNRAHLAMQT